MDRTLWGSLAEEEEPSSSEEESEGEEEEEGEETGTETPSGIT